MEIRELLEYLARALVDHPEDVKVREVKGEDHYCGQENTPHRPLQKQAVAHQGVKRWCVRKSSADAFMNHLSQQTRQFLVLEVDVFDDLLRSWSKPAVTPV